MGRVIGGVLMFVVLALIGACTPVGKMTHDMTAMIQSAKTKADHEALAKHYEDEATALQAKAAEHQRMEQTYTGMSSWGKARISLSQHCSMLAARYREAANENLALARQHRELAAHAPE